MNVKRFVLIGAAAVAFMASLCCKPPNVPERPAGSPIGVQGQPYACSTRTTDPGGGMVAYQFRWDGVEGSWSDFVAGDIFFTDTHTFTTVGQVVIQARAKTECGKASDWSEEFTTSIAAGRGQVVWKIEYAHPEDPEDLSSFSLNTFGLSPDGDAYIGTEYGRVICRPASGAGWKFPGDPEFEEEFASGCAVGSDGTIYAGNAGDGKLYAINPDGSQRWARIMSGEIYSTPALGEDGAIFIQTEEAVHAIEPDGTERWVDTSYGGGMSSPAIGEDGALYVVNEEGVLCKRRTVDGFIEDSLKITNQSVYASLAIDRLRSQLYAVDEDGNLWAIVIPLLQQKWTSPTSLGDVAGTPCIGRDGTVYATGGGTLWALDPEGGNVKWTFGPPMGGTMSSPAVSDSGFIYVLVTLSKKDFGPRPAQEDVDSLFGVNEEDGSRAWATALGEGESAEYMSAPKIDASGRIYVGSGYAAWCLGGAGGPAQSSWPMFQRDGMSSGRAR